MSEMFETARCGSCGAEVIWAATDGGKRMPVDVKPIGKTLRLYRDGIITRVSVIDAYQTHFKTCPDAVAHRKGGA